MRILHTADLHIGKVVNNYSMVEDQRYILDQLIETVKERGVEAVCISGDVYDRSVPPVEAVSLFDDFLTRLTALSVPVLIISGNHDSWERLSFAADIIAADKVFIAGKDSLMKKISLEDEAGEVDFYLLPFVTPHDVRRLYPDKSFPDYDSAVRFAVEEAGVDYSRRNVLLCHQFVTGAVLSDSEELSVGGVDNIGADIFEGFTYTALGHIHRPQNVKKNLRYSGSILKYSFSEIPYSKSLTLVDIDGEGRAEISEVPLRPLHDMREIRGSFDELMSKEYFEGTAREDYLLVTLTDEEEIPFVIRLMSQTYPNIMSVRYENLKTSYEEKKMYTEDVSLSPVDLIAEFYEKQNNTSLPPELRELTERVIERLELDSEK